MILGGFEGWTWSFRCSLGVWGGDFEGFEEG